MKRLSCAEAGELVTAYLDEYLAEETRRAFEEHTKGCPDCSRHIDQFRATIGALGDFPGGPLSPAVRERLLAAFRASRNR